MTPKLSLGPILYYWPRDVVFDFYRGITETPVDIVYLGETVCPKRRVLSSEDWLELAQRLQDSGKQVVLSTLTLLEAGSELSSLRRLCKNNRFMVEANDLAAVQFLKGTTSFVTGPSINIYNDRTLHLLAELGLKRWVMPLELSRDALEEMQHLRPEGVETEVFAFGRMPLAYSARCFTARAQNLPKDECRFLCLDHPDGLLLSTQERDPFLVLNGIQTQSAHTLDLLGQLDELKRLGVDVLRISPQSRHTAEIIELFHACLNGIQSMTDCQSGLYKLMPVGPCDGYWYGRPGMESQGTGSR